MENDYFQKIVNSSQMQALSKSGLIEVNNELLEVQFRTSAVRDLKVKNLSLNPHEEGALVVTYKDNMYVYYPNEFGVEKKIQDTINEISLLTDVLLTGKGVSLRVIGQCKAMSVTGELGSVESTVVYSKYLVDNIKWLMRPIFHPKDIQLI